MDERGYSRFEELPQPFHKVQMYLLDKFGKSVPDHRHEQLQEYGELLLRPHLQ